MKNEIHIDEQFFITDLIPRALIQDKSICINPAQYESVYLLCIEIADKPVRLSEVPHYINTNGPNIIIDESIPHGEYRLFSRHELMDFKLENEPGTWHNYLKNNPTSVHGCFNCAGDYIWPTGEITRNEDI